MAWCRGIAIGGPPARLEGAGTSPKPATVGLLFALACLTRYEAWPITASAMLMSVWSLCRIGQPAWAAGRQVAAIAIYPMAAIAAFVLFSRIVVGEWLTTSGFFVAENAALGQPITALGQVLWGARALSGSLSVSAAGVGLGVLLVTALGVRSRQSSVGSRQSTVVSRQSLVGSRPSAVGRLGEADSLIVLSLVTSAALPWAAFLRGHPFRIRYLVPLLAAQAIGVGVVLGAVSRFTLVGAAIVAAVVASDLRPLSPSAPMVVEAQWDRPNARARLRVTDCLRLKDDGGIILASMGSLGHYMQELARIGVDVKRFLHEGNGELWQRALEDPRPYASWLLIEERAEGGDWLAHLARENPAFLEGFARECEGGGVALYRRAATTPRP
jgi:hypothetical protein